MNQFCLVRVTHTHTKMSFMKRMDTYRTIELEDGFQVVGYKDDAYAEYKVGVHYWQHCRRLREIYLLLSRGLPPDTVNPDVLITICRDVFNSLFGELLSKANMLHECYNCVRSCQFEAWAISEHSIKSLWPRLNSSTIDLQAGSTFFHNGKPLYVPHEVFHFDISNECHIKYEEEKMGLEKLATLWMYRLFAILFGISLTFFTFSTYLTLTTEVAERCVATDVERVCSSFKLRLFVAFLMQFLTYPSPGILMIIILYVITRYIVTYERIHAYYKAKKKWVDRDKNQACQNLIDECDAKRLKYKMNELFVKKG